LAWTSFTRFADIERKKNRKKEVKFWLCALRKGHLSSAVSGCCGTPSGAAWPGPAPPGLQKTRDKYPNTPHTRPELQGEVTELNG